MILGLILGAAPPAHGAEPSGRLSPLERFNYVLGTQTFGVKYQFTEATKLVETARVIRELGCNNIKFALGRNTFDSYGLPPRADLRWLADIAANEPSVRAVLDMPFAFYLLWAAPLAHGETAWSDGFSEEEQQAEYDEIHSLARHLLTTHSGTGKVFLLGHWEGDWWLHPGYQSDITPSPTRIEGMVAWLNTRQQAVDAARRDTPHANVEVYHYTEVNLVQKAMQGKPCLTNSVLPRTRVDFVSYSSYDSIGNAAGNCGPELRKALDYIESKLPPKKGLATKRVFIGEFGFPLAKAGSPQRQDEYARDVCRVALEWGCPFVLYWAVYCNEKTPAGQHRGFWLVDDQGQKQPFYFTLAEYFRRSRAFVSRYQSEQGRLPSDREFRAAAVRFLGPADREP